MRAVQKEELRIKVFSRFLFLVVTASVFLASCSSGPYSDRPRSSAENREDHYPEVSPRIDDTESARGRGGSAVRELIQEADRQLEEGQHEAAAASAERAIRIAPLDPQAYFALAQVRFFQAQYGLSRSLLLKARSLATSANMLRAIEGFLARPEYD